MSNVPDSVGDTDWGQRMTAEQVHPLAGKPAPASLLVNVPKLVTAYYAERPDPSEAAQRVVFGTSGHRGSSLQASFNEALLEREIVPAFYTRDGSGIPTAWVARMRESMATLTPRFSTNRVVREYTERYYLPAAAAYRKRAADKGALAARLVAWQRHLAEHWHEARFGAVRVETRGGEHGFMVELRLGRLEPEAVRVELYANAVDRAEPLRHAMARGRSLGGSGGGYEYAASVPASRPAGDYTPRLVPHHPEAGMPLEAPQILWQR